MTCNCIKQVEEGIKKQIENDEKLRKKIIRNGVIDSVEHDGIAFAVIRGLESNSLKQMTTNQAIVTYTYITEKGEKKTMKRKRDIEHKYCPYCGEKY